MATVVTVFGATGFIGSSVARALAKDYHVRAVTRDPNSSTAQALAREGIQIVYVNTTDARSIEDALRGANACFAQTHSNFQSTSGYGEEVAYGKLIADACAKEKVGHVIYSTQLTVVRVLGMRAQHMDAKAEVEQYMKDKGLPLTGVVIPVTYESLLTSPLRPKKVETDFYKFQTPMGSVPLSMICTEDMGDIVHAILAGGRQYLDHTLGVCGDKLTIDGVSQVFSRVLDPLRFKDRPVTLDEFRGLNHPAANDYAMMFDFYCRVDQRASIDLTKKLNPGVQSLHQWLSANKDIAIRAIQDN